jgi:hypothetical protein
MSNPRMPIKTRGGFSRPVAVTTLTLGFAVANSSIRAATGRKRFELTFISTVVGKVNSIAVNRAKSDPPTPKTTGAGSNTELSGAAR